MTEGQSWRSRERSFLKRSWTFVSARFDPKSHLGLGLTIRLVLFALAVWAFSGLLDAVLDNETLVRLDKWIAAWFSAHATATGRSIFNAITQLGLPVVYALMGLVAVYLWRTGQRAQLVTWIAANGGGKA